MHFLAGCYHEMYGMKELKKKMRVIKQFLPIYFKVTIAIKLNILDNTYFFYWHMENAQVK